MTAPGYQQIAARVLDTLHAYGQCDITNVADTDALRRAIRTEARHRKVKLQTRAPGKDFVLAIAQEQSVEAQAYLVVTRSLIRDAMTEMHNAAREDRPARRMIDPSVRTIDASDVEA
jgi:hypothetical protein